MMSSLKSMVVKRNTKNRLVDTERWWENDIQKTTSYTTRERRNRLGNKDLLVVCLVIITMELEKEVIKRGTYFEIEQLERRVEKLELILEKFMEQWGPDVQKRRDERDRRWDEMIRVLTVQERNSEKKI